MSDNRPSPVPPPRSFISCAAEGSDGQIISPLPQEATIPLDTLQADGAYSIPSGTPKKTPKKNQQEAHEDFDRSFQVDADMLRLKRPVANGEGGIGEVWIGELVDHNGSVHAVAVKRYPSAFGPEEMKMFRRETAVLFLAAMRCHNVCKVYGTAVKDGKLCIIMKLYKESMRGLLSRTPGRKLPLVDAKRYGAEICRAIVELHEQQIILQDLKPANILLDEYDHCVLADFGISKFMQGSSPHMPSHVQGTFNYMSPEAFDPEQFGGITTQTDSWSFACTLLEMLTGDQPWKGLKMAAICFKVMQREVPSIPQGLPTVLEHMLRRCFSFQPHDRPTFKEIYEVFRAEWEVGGAGVGTMLKPKSDDAIGLLVGGALDVLGMNARSTSDTRFSPSSVNPSANRFVPGGALDAFAENQVHEGVVNDSLMVGLYKRAAEADNAKREAQLAKSELQSLKRDVVLLREDSESADIIAKNANSSKEEVVGQLNKVMGVCDELQKERKSLAQQLLDLQDQLIAQEKKMSHDVQCWQATEEAKRHAEEQLAEVTSNYQEMSKKLAKSLHLSKTVEKLENELSEANATIQNLVRKLEAITQELISVTEDRDKFSDEFERLRKETRARETASGALQDEYDNIRVQMDQMRDAHSLEIKQERQARERNEAKMTAMTHSFGLQNEDARRKISELEAQLDAKTREVAYAKSSTGSALDVVKKEVMSQLSAVREENKLLNRRLESSASEKLKLEQQVSELEAQNACLSAALDNSTLAEHQAQTSLLEEQLLRGRTDDKERYEKERAQWQRDRDSLTSCLQDMEEMEVRCRESDGRALALASEKRQLESERLAYMREAEVDRAKLEQAIAKQRTDFEKRILELEQRFQKMKEVRIASDSDSPATSDATVVSTRSMTAENEVRLICSSDLSGIGGGRDTYSPCQQKVYSSIDAERSGEVHDPSEAFSINDALHTADCEGDRARTVTEPVQEARDAQMRVRRTLQSASSFNQAQSQGPFVCSRDSFPPPILTSKLKNSKPSSPGHDTIIAMRETHHPRHKPDCDITADRAHDALADLRQTQSSPPPVIASSIMLEGAGPKSSPRGNTSKSGAWSASRRRLEAEGGGGAGSTGTARRGEQESSGAQPSTPLGKAGGEQGSPGIRQVGPYTTQTPRGRSLGVVLDGARVKSVLCPSPAFLAGIRVDDVVRHVNGIAVGRADVMAVLRAQWLAGAGPLSLVLERDSSALRFIVQRADEGRKGSTFASPSAEAGVEPHSDAC